MGLSPLLKCPVVEAVLMSVHVTPAGCMLLWIVFSPRGGEDREGSQGVDQAPTLELVALAGVRDQAAGEQLGPGQFESDTEA